MLKYCIVFCIRGSLPCFVTTRRNKDSRQTIRGLGSAEKGLTRLALLIWETRDPTYFEELEIEDSKELV